MIRSVAILVSLVTANVAVSQKWPLDVKTYRELRTWGWITEKWDGNDAPYRQIMDKIRQQVRNKKNLEAIYETYIAAVEQNPKSAIDQFARGYYLLWMVKTKGIDFKKRKYDARSALLLAWNGLVRAPSPRSRSYARLRFLIEIREAADFKLLSMGERLFKSDPLDMEVKYEYADLLKFSPKRSDIDKSLVLAKELLIANPKSAYYHYLIGDCYVSLMFSTKKKSYGELAIQSFERSFEFRKDAEWISWTKHILKATRDSMKKMSGAKDKPSARS